MELGKWAGEEFSPRPWPPGSRGGLPLVLGRVQGGARLGLRSKTELALPTPYVQRYVVSLEAQDIWKPLGNDAGPACWPAWLAGGVGAAPRVSTPLLVAGWVHGVRT